jgi:hypothetical protein
VYVLVGNRQELGELAEPRCRQVRMAVQTAGTARSLDLSDIYSEHDDTAATKQVTFAVSSMGRSTAAGGDLVGRRNNDRVRGRNDDMPKNKGHDW